MSRSWLVAYALVVLLWGASYGITEIALTAFSPGEVAMWRALVGAGFLAVLLVAGGTGLPRLRTAGVVRILALAGLTTVASVSAAAAQCRMPSGIVAVLCAMTPLFCVIFYRLRRIPTAPTKWIGVCLGVVGVAVLLSPSGNLDGVAVVLGLTAAACYALAGVLAAAFFSGSKFSGTQLTMAQLLASGALLVPVTAVSDTAPSLLEPAPVAALLALGVLVAAVGNVLFWRVVRQAGPVVAATTYQTVPAVAIVVGVVVLGEPFGIAEFTGAALVFTGLALQLPRSRRAAHQSPAAVVALRQTGDLQHRQRPQHTSGRQSGCDRDLVGCARATPGQRLVDLQLDLGERVQHPGGSCRLISQFA